MINWVVKELEYEQGRAREGIRNLDTSSFPSPYISAMPTCAKPPAYCKPEWLDLMVFDETLPD